MVSCVTWGSIVSVDADAICIVFECCWFKRWSYLPSPLGISQQLGTELLAWGAQPATCLAIGRSAKPTSATNRRAAAACGPSPSKRPFSAPVPWRWAKASVTSRSSWDLGPQKRCEKFDLESKMAMGTCGRCFVYWWFLVISRFLMISIILNMVMIFRYVAYVSLLEGDFLPESHIPTGPSTEVIWIKNSPCRSRSSLKYSRILRAST